MPRLWENISPGGQLGPASSTQLQVPAWQGEGEVWGQVIPRSAPSEQRPQWDHRNGEKESLFLSNNKEFLYTLVGAAAMLHSQQGQSLRSPTARPTNTLLQGLQLPCRQANLTPSAPGRPATPPPGHRRQKYGNSIFTRCVNISGLYIHFIHHSAGPEVGPGGSTAARLPPPARPALCKPRSLAPRALPQGPWVHEELGQRGHTKVLDSNTGAEQATSTSKKRAWGQGEGRD